MKNDNVNKPMNGERKQATTRVVGDAAMVLLWTLMCVWGGRIVHNNIADGQFANVDITICLSIFCGIMTGKSIVETVISAQKLMQIKQKDMPR